MSSKNFEVSILVQNYSIISDGDRGDQTIDKLSDGLSISADYSAENETLSAQAARLIIIS